MSKDPETNNFGIVMDYKVNGSLCEYLDKNHHLMCMYERIDILRNIAIGLKNMDEKDMVHRDFHSGNIVKANLLIQNLI